MNRAFMKPTVKLRQTAKKHAWVSNSAETHTAAERNRGPLLGSSISVLWALRAGSFFAVGSVLHLVGCLDAHSDLIPLSD